VNASSGLREGSLPAMVLDQDGASVGPKQIRRSLVKY